MKKIGILCAASETIDKSYYESAERVGRMIGESGYTLVYGGASLGLMECVARAVKQSGGEVIGVVPSKLEENNRVSKLLDKMIPCRNLSERKDIMQELSDVMVALPGGVGTLDEIFHVVAAASIGYHHKRVVLYNADGFYNSLIATLEEMCTRGFMRHALTDYIVVAGSLSELASVIDNTDN